MSEKITIEVDQDAALARHIEDLQRVITRRNKTIEELENRIEALNQGALTTEQREVEFLLGYNQALENTHATAHKAVEALKELGKGALSEFRFD